jgi:non-heme chloroperoxidase
MPCFMRRALIRALLGMAVLLPGAPRAQQVLTVGSQWFTTSDGVHLHYLQAGRPSAHTLVLVPGWTMPGWIFGPQLAELSSTYHVIAFDPRGQGDSDTPLDGYEPGRRGQDIAELIEALGGAPVVLAGWSLGVLDTLAYAQENGDSRIAGLVLVDNSVGEDPAPVPPHHIHVPHPYAPVPREVEMRRFVEGMFLRPQPEEYLQLLTQATLHTPEFASRELLRYPEPRTYWRDALYATDRPVLYIVRPRFAAQAENVARHDPLAETVVISDAGHALFVDDASRFNELIRDFISRRIWR